MTTEMQTLNLDQIRIDGGTQPRVEIDEGLITDYREGYKSGATIPPVTVFGDGVTYWLADGFHRYFARKQLGLPTIEVELHTGTLRDAILFSVGANASHGKRRTIDDKRKAVNTLLTNDLVTRDEGGKPWSDREIAKRCKVSHTFVANLREGLISSHTGNVASMKREPDAQRQFIHPKTGKPAVMKTGNIGRSRKRKFNPTGGIAKDAFSTPAPHSLQSRVPMKNVDLPLNNPRKAAHCMVSVYGEEYMRTLCDELNHLFKEGHSND